MKTTTRLLTGLAILLAGCVTVGHNFDAVDLGWVKPGETTKAAILDKLGDPFRVGVDAGDPTWTYGYYKYRLMGGTVTKDLVFRFAADGKVKSFTLNTSFPQDKAALEPALQSSTTG